MNNFRKKQIKQSKKLARDIMKDVAKTYEVLLRMERVGGVPFGSVQETVDAQQAKLEKIESRISRLIFQINPQS